ncbi:hypothetical protein HIM_11632 [Hirsutella minnesotensis 3608]|uniref:Uncharacterized protein n=1 Tax=Hirsutella minnesotensis 3608 TaxID=1043627 RepID=A0A0F7ZIW5_9HYPO|nr:hypothetical protein HIM_11632 [Hirsutella minnesotensis 3608]
MAVIGIKYDSGLCALTSTANDESPLCEFYPNVTPDNFTYDYMFEMKHINMASFLTVLSAVDQKVFMDMLIAVSSAGETVGCMSVLEIIYVCAKMKLLEDKVTTAEIRRYVFMGLMKEASALKGESIKFTVIPAPATGDQVDDNTAGNKAPEPDDMWAVPHKKGKKDKKSTGWTFNGTFAS